MDNIDWLNLSTSSLPNGYAEEIVESDQYLSSTGSSIPLLYYLYSEAGTTAWSIIFEEKAPILISLQEVVDSTKLNVSQLAQVFDVSRPTIYKWLKNDTDIQASNEQKIGRLVRFVNSLPTDVTQVLARISNRNLVSGNTVIDVLSAVQNGTSLDTDIVEEISNLATEWTTRSEKSSSLSSLRDFSESGISRAG